MTWLLRSIAHSLKLPPSRVYGVASFYHFFSLVPKGQHTCVVCMGTPCYVKGAPGLLAAIEDYAQICAGQTTPDNLLSLEKVRLQITLVGSDGAILDEVIQ